jgi:lipoate-protein ligase A
VIEARMDVDSGIIREFKIYGDFTGEQDVVELEEKLVGIRYDPEAIISALNNIDIRPYFGDLDRAEFIDLLY